MKPPKRMMVTMTVLMLAITIAAAVLMGAHRSDAFDIGDFSGVDIAAAESAFAQSGDNADLITLVKALCWRYRQQGDDAAREPLKVYGAVLTERAKNEQIDLEKADEDGALLQVLSVLNGLDE